VLIRLLYRQGRVLLLAHTPLQQSRGGAVVEMQTQTQRTLRFAVRLVRVYSMRCLRPY